VVTEKKARWVGGMQLQGGYDGLFTFSVARVIDPPRYNAH
jgi:hypothetical protein